MDSYRCRVTVYYQPTLCHDWYHHDLPLFRTTSKGRYYTPDFLLKIHHEGQKPVYIVLDAKYTSQRNLLFSQNTGDHYTMSTLEEIILKYFFQLASTDGSGIKAVWILQGRMDGAQRHHYHDSNLSKKHPPLMRCGIIPVNTQDKATLLWEEIGKELESPPR